MVRGSFGGQNCTGGSKLGVASVKHPEKLLPSEAAEALGVTPRTLISWEKSGKIPPPERDFRGWRLYDRKTIQEMRRRLLGGDEAEQPGLEIPGMELSARNRISGIVKEIDSGAVMCEVVVKTGSDEEIAALISKSSLRRLGLRVGDRVTAIFDSADVLLAR